MVLVFVRGVAWEEGVRNTLGHLVGPGYCLHMSRTDVDIDDDVMAKPRKAGGFKTGKAAVEEGLRLLVRTRTQGRRLRTLRGKLRSEGSLDDRRRDR